MGKIICAGLGPGDPELMSVKADRLVRSASHVAYFRKAGRAGQARQIVEGMLAPGVTEYPMEYPVTTEIPFCDPEYNRVLAAFYDDWASRLATLAETESVLVLCEGDPFFYGSFMHLYARLQGQPITWGDDVLTVLMATLPEEELAARARDADALVVMKIGRNLPKLRRALAKAGRLGAAWLIERGTMPGQSVQLLTEAEAAAPYFSIVVVHGHGRRP